MAGYNTIIRLLWLKKQSIVVPFRTEEQRYRAKYLEDFGHFKIIDYNSLSIDVLGKTVVEMLNNPLESLQTMNTDDFKGVENTIRLLENVQYQ